MIWLYVLFVLLIALLLILFVPINLVVKYNGKLKIKMKFMGIPLSIPSFNINSAKDIKNKKIKKRKKKKHSPKNIWNTAKKIGIILKAAKKTITCVAKKIKIHSLKLILYVGDKDAAAAAIKYGQANAAIYPILSALDNISPPKKTNVKIIPDFLSEKVTADFKIDIKSSIFNLLALVILIFREYKKLYNFKKVVFK